MVNKNIREVIESDGFIIDLSEKAKLLYLMLYAKSNEKGIVKNPYSLVIQFELGADSINDLEGAGLIEINNFADTGNVYFKVPVKKKEIEAIKGKAALEEYDKIMGG